MRRNNLLILLSLLAGCGAGAPTGEDPEGFGIIRPPPGTITHFFDWLAPPTNLLTSTNPQDCNNHIPAPWGALGGTQGCAAALENGQVLLTWDWAKSSSPPAGSIDRGQPDGYRIYASLAGNPPVKWDEQTTSYEWTTKAVAPGPQGVNTCFTVRAYKGALESADSPARCLTGWGSPLKTVRLSPSAMRSMETSGGDMFYGVEPGPASDQFRVGWHHHFKQTLVGPNNYFYWDWRAGVLFDLNPYKGHTIMGATLKIHQAYTDIDMVFPVAKSCLSEVGYALQDFMSEPDGTKLENEVQFELDDILTTDRTFDVTKMVRSWTGPGARPNLGFAFNSWSYGYAEDSTNCESTYDQVELDITYF